MICPVIRMDLRMPNKLSEFENLNKSARYRFFVTFNKISLKISSKLHPCVERKEKRVNNAISSAILNGEQICLFLFCLKKLT